MQEQNRNDQETDDKAASGNGSNNNVRLHENEMEDLLACGMEHRLSDISSDSDEGNCDLFLSPAAEMAKYLAVKTLPKSMDTLKWWSTTNKLSYLQQLASKYLSMAATSASSERSFSSAGMAVNDRRTQLSDEHLEVLNVLYCNHELLNG